MTIKVKLKDIVDEMEVQMEESRAFLNVKTGEIVPVTLEDLGAAEEGEPFEHLLDWQQQNRLVAIDVIENDGKYLELPDRYEINEYDIMEDFCLTVSDDRKRESLLKAIRGKGAFRRFKDKIYEFNIAEQWYAYRDERLKEIAMEWCKDNKISYIES